MVSPWGPDPSNLKAYERLGYFRYSGETRLMIQIVFYRDVVITRSELHQYIGYIDGLGHRNPKLYRV